MPKTKISEFDVDPANNTDINSINIAEGCAPSGINNAIRQLMSDLKEFQTGAGGDSITAVGLFSDTVGEKTAAAGVTIDGVLLKDGIVTAPINGTVGATTPASGAFTTLSASGAFSANGGATLGDASGDALTINSSAVSIPNGLNFDSNTFVIDATNNAVGIGTSSPSSFGKFVVKQSADTSIASLGVVSQASSTDTFISIGYHSTSDTARLNTSYISTGAFKPLSFWTSDVERMRISTTGGLSVGTTTDAGSGAILASGNITAYSDERLKKDWANLSPTFLEDLAKVKYGTYTRIDSGERQVGASAQDMQKILPESVLDGEHLSLAYGNAALVAAIELSKQVIELRKRLEILESK